LRFLPALQKATAWQATPHSDFAADFEMRSIETPQRFGFVVRDIDAGDASRKSVNAKRQSC
jgi:hypothetical protein